MKFLIYGAIAIGVLYFIFAPSNVDLAIDNPSDQSITVSVDELTVEVPGKEVVWVEMGKGNHKVTLANGEETEYEFTESAYMLNPTMSEYLVEEHFFGDLQSQLSYMSNQVNRDSIEFMGFPLPGSYQKVDQLINKVTWQIGARENVPESVEADASENYVVIKKLIDQNEFWDMVMESMKQAAEGEQSEG